VSAPATVIVPAGSTSASFNVVALKTGTVTITGIYGVTRATTLDVTSCGTLPTVGSPGTAPDVTWLDDTPPSGVTLSGGTPVSSQAASGTTSFSLAGSGKQQFTLSGGTTWTAVSGDSLVVYALINPCKPPREIQVIWKDSANTEYRVSWGEDVIDATTPHFQNGPMIAGGTWLRLEALASTLGIAGKSITSITVQTFDGEAWFDLIGKTTCAFTAAAAHDLNAADVVWYDDAVPSGATIVATDTWTLPFVWDSTQKATGTTSHTDALRSGVHGHGIANAPSSVVLRSGDVLVTYVLIDPCNPVREILLQWQDVAGGWNHRAYWGENLFPAWGNDGTSEMYRMGPLPRAGQWARLEVPISLVGLDNTSIIGDWFGVYDGRAWFDHVGKVSRVNLAFGKNASQSSTYVPAAPASIAVDGVTNGTYATNSITHTNNDFQAWWQVDLGSVQPIEDIQVWGRVDGYPERIVDYWMFVSDTPFTSTDLAATRSQAHVSAYHYPTQMGTSRDFRIGRSGRYVRFQLNNANWLSLSEVQVWAPASSMAVNLAGGMAATQWPATFKDPNLPVPYYAEFAVNGDANGLPGVAGSITHTTADTNPHWDVDLGAIRPISTVEVSRRLDCVSACPNQIQDFYLFVSDVPFGSDLVANTIAQSGVGVWYHGLQLLPSASIPVCRTGRYVRVARSLPSNAPDVVALNEVRVWSNDAPLTPLVTTPSPTEQDSSSVIRLH